MKIMVTKAGNTSVKSFQSSLVIFVIIIVPTIINAGAVAAEGTKPTIGLKNKASKKKRDTNTPVSPVRPPAPTPAADST